MSYYRFVLLASVCVAPMWCGCARMAHAESLNQAVQAAVTDHPSVTAATANRDALGEDTREKRSNYFPQLNTEVTGGRIYGDNATSRGLSVTRGAGYSGYGSGSVNLSERIFDGFETSNRVGAARARRDSADFNIADVREDLALRTTLAYLDVLRGQESLDHLRAYGKTIDNYISRIEKAVKEGGADATLREQARDIKAQLDNTIASSQGQLQTAIATCTELIGHAPQEPLEKPVPALDIMPATAVEAVAYAHDHHPMLKAASLTEQAATMDSKAEQAAYYPALNGQLSYLKSDEKDLLGGELVDARAVVKLDWNYALGGAEQARVRKALRQSEQSRAQKQDMERQIERRIQIAYSDRATAQDQLTIQQQRVKLNEGLFGTQTQQFEGGKVNLLQLLQSDNSLFNARLAEMNNEYKALSTQYTILASMGRLQDSLKDAPNSKSVTSEVISTPPIPEVSKKTKSNGAVSAAPLPSAGFKAGTPLSPPEKSAITAPAAETLLNQIPATPAATTLQSPPAAAVKPALAPVMVPSTAAPGDDPAALTHAR